MQENIDELKCKICGKLAKDDRHFYKLRQLCNRHALQLRNHGKVLDTKIKNNPPRVFWTDEDKKILDTLLSQGKTYAEIAEVLHKSRDAVGDMVIKLGLNEKYLKKNSIHYTAIYQDYDWCYDRYITQGLSHEEMAKEANASIRVIQKWCVEIYNLHERTFKEFKQLTSQQRELIIAGTLGDGHIDQRSDQPMYIESHAEDEKDYLFWKYNMLKDLCKSEPSYYEAQYHNFSSDNTYLCKPFYRFETRIINALKEIRNMTRMEKIKGLSEFQVAVLFLDDGSRGKLWELCVAEWNAEETSQLLSVLEEKFKVRGKICKDTRYLYFDALSSVRLDNIILTNIPNELDIIHKKILDNKKIKPLSDRYYIITNEQRIGLATYCKQNHVPYEKARKLLIQMDLDFHEITETDLLTQIKKVG